MHRHTHKHTHTLASWYTGQCVRKGVTKQWSDSGPIKSLRCFNNLLLGGEDDIPSVACSNPKRIQD